VKQIFRELWEKHSVESPKAAHANVNEPAPNGKRQRMSKKRQKAVKEGRATAIKTESIRFTPLGSVAVMKKLHADKRLMRRLEKLGVKTKPSWQTVAALRPWYVYDLDPEAMEVCVCQMHTEPEHLMR
jgi:hypothetical protein